MEERIFKDELKYLISYPDGFREGGKYPLLIFLHGRSARLESTEKLHQYPSLAFLREHQNEKGFILLAPHCKSGNWSEWIKMVIQLLETFRELPYIDNTRWYLTGLSLGGYGTWELATFRADWFAAAMPLCGGGIPATAKELGKLPIRAFHGLCDTTVDPSISLQMVSAVNLVGGDAELILFPKEPHNCAERVYTDKKNIDWLFSFTNERD